MFTTKNELQTHMNVSSIDVITNGDDTIVLAAIDTAVAEAKGYLSLFNTSAIFSATDANRNALLLTFVKDIAVWHLVVLSNYQADIELRKDRYERACAWLKQVMRGEVIPDLPRLEVSTENPGTIIYGSNPKRSQHF